MKRRLLSASILSALAAAPVADAVEYSFYGHINRAMQFVDDGKGSDIRFVDNDTDSSRFGFKGSDDIGKGFRAGARLEAAWQSNLSSSDSPDNGGGVKGGDFVSSGASSVDTNLRIRHVYGWFESEKFGTLSLGQTSDSNDNVAKADLSGAWVAAEYPNDQSLGYNFRTSAGGVSGISVFASLGSLDGGRRDLVKYDTPTFGPVGFSVSAATNNRVDTSMTVDTPLAGGQFLAAIGYSKSQPSVAPSPGGTRSTISGSASYLFSQGTNIYFAYGEQEAPFGRPAGVDDDARRWLISLGHDWGNNAFRVIYSNGENFTAGCDSDNVQVGFVHNIPAPKVDVYAYYSYNDLNCSNAGLAANGFAPGTSFEDINVAGVGSRIKFD